MQNKGTIRLFTVLFALVCAFQLYFTWEARSVEKDAKAYANGDAAQEQYYLDSIASEPVMDIGVKEYTYSEVKSKELNLGLDLKGGINVILEVSVKDILRGLSNNSSNATFNAALDAASKAQAGSQKDYATLFFEEFSRINAESATPTRLASPEIFGNKNLREKINPEMTDDEVASVIRVETDGSIDRAFTVLRTRIDKFGVAQPNIQRLENSGRILVELPGVKDAERVKKLLQTTAKLEFWTVHQTEELFQFFSAANNRLKDLVETTAVAAEETTTEVDSLLGDTAAADSLNTFQQSNPLFEKLQFGQQGSPVVGYAAIKDTAAVNEFLAKREIRQLLPAHLQHVKFLWANKPLSNDRNIMELYAIQGSRGGEAPLTGDVITDANAGYDQYSNPEVSMSMNRSGAVQWERITTDNKGRFIAIVLDNYVYSCPRVNDPIKGGRSQISGNFTVKETEDLANVLKAGKLPAAARIIQAEVVGPSLGQEAIDHGSLSFALALVVIFIWMVIYYGKGGLYSDVALIANILFIFGVLASLGATLTLPGIAGIVLTIGMSVDANVLIYERIREELRNGKGVKLAVKDGYRGAYSSILDANITTFLTGIVLFVFGTGPVQGFATTLIIGIITSLISAIFITRLFIDADLNKGRTPSFSTKWSEKLFTNLNFDFIGKRKMAYMISGAALVLSIIGFGVRGLDYGVDFVGGRTFTVRFENTVNTNDVADALEATLINEDGRKLRPEVKTFGADNQVKITTKYKIDSEDPRVDEEANQKVFEGVQSFLPAGFTYEQFVSGEGLGIMQSVKVGPTIADDIKDAAFMAVFFALAIVFLYILIRFRKVAFSAGAVAAVFHDTILVIGLFAWLHGVLPFSLEIDQAFIAAILTVIGYSLNDTVVVFDRIREVVRENTRLPFLQLVNKAINTTLSRTVNTSLTTLFVILVIFIWGGETIRGFMFALMVGVIVGTYSSVFIATPIMVDLSKKEIDREESHRKKRKAFAK